MDTEAPAMKRLLLVLLIAGLLVAPSMAFRTTFQDWTLGQYTNTNTLTLPLSLNTTTGLFYANLPSNGNYAQNAKASPSTYIAYDTWYYGTQINLYDSSSAGVGNMNSGTNPGTLGAPSRVEIYDSAGTTTVYINGAYSSSLGYHVNNPAYLKFLTSSYANRFSAVTMGESDHHVITTFPNNWSLVKDLISPASTGLYSYDVSTGMYDVVRNSNNFYVLADTDSQAGLGNEQLIIEDNEGNIVNTTMLNSATPSHLVSYNINQFLTAANGHYGQFSIHFANSSVYTYFSVIGSGASVSLDKSQYTVGDTMTATYVVTPSYWDTSTYDYTMKFISATDGSTLATNVIGSSSGTSTYTLKSTDTSGVVYAALVATPKTPAGSAGIWMNYAYATFMQYSTFIGYVNDAQAGTVIPGAVLTMNQSGSLYTTTTGATGNYTTSGTSFVTGIPLQINTTATGYFPYNATITPASETTILLNISMNSTSPSYTGEAVAGVIRDGIFGGQIITNGYGRPIPAATAYIKNTTFGQYCTNVSNVAGWYKFDETNGCMLTSGRLYNVWSSKAGFANSPNYTVVAT